MPEQSDDLQGAGVGDDFRDDARQAPQQRHNLYIVNQPSPLKQYNEGRLTIHFVLQPCATDGDGVYVTLAANGCAADPRLDHAIRVSDNQLRQRSDADSGQQNVVLIEIVELRENPEIDVAAATSALGVKVRLQPLHESDELRRRASQFTRVAPIEVGLLFVDREACVTGRYLTRAPNGCGSEMVKSRAKIVDCIADDGRHVIRQWPIEHPTNCEPWTIRVVIDDFDAVWVIAEEGIEQAFQLSDVAVCSREL